jgi:salicylate hydroxylase
LCNINSTKAISLSEYPLRIMDTLNDTFDFSSRRAAKPLKAIIVGAGIAGLTLGIGLKRTGHDVTILEQVHEIAEVGAGIQMAPNNTRILARFGLLEEVLKCMNVLTRNSLR